MSNSRRRIIALYFISRCPRTRKVMKEIRADTTK
jgi:hypothetical protein